MIKRKCDVCGKKIQVGFYKIKLNMEITTQLLILQDRVIFEEPYYKHPEEKKQYTLNLCGHCAHKIINFFENSERRRGSPKTIIPCIKKLKKLLYRRHRVK